MTRDPVPLIELVGDYAIREINALEARIVAAEDDADAMLWEQARQVVAQLKLGGLSQRQLAAQWINVRTGEAYSHVHVFYTAEVVKLAYQAQPRPRFREIYNEIAHAARRRAAEEENRLTLERQIEVEQLGIFYGDFRARYREVIPAESAQLVLTDPPYDEDSVPLFGAIAEAAKHVLRPGGSLLVYSGQKHLGEAMAAMTAHLRYWWTFSLVHAGQAQLLQKLGLRCHWKPVIWCVKETRGNVAAIIPDVIDGGGREKDAHAWQQAEAEAARLIERFTNPGDFVVDFCAGSGTVLVAAKMLGRRYAGFETRAENVEKIVRRIT